MHLFSDQALIVTHSYYLLFFIIHYYSYLLVFLSQQIVLENLTPALTDHVQLQSNRSVQRRLDNPARADPLSISYRPAQVVLGCNHWGTLLTHCYLLIVPLYGWLDG